MEKPIEKYWNIRLNSVEEILQANNFQVHVATDGNNAREIALNDILPQNGAESVSFGGSMTVVATALYDAF